MSTIKKFLDLAKVDERGVRHSEGQRRHIGNTRAIYHDLQVLVLDEATSALSNLTGQVVMEAMHNLGHSKIIINIIHRLSTVQPCDEIFVWRRAAGWTRALWRTREEQPLFSGHGC